MTLAEYYNAQFRDDLPRVLDAVPSLHDHGDDTVAIQPRTISRRNHVVRRWSVERRMLFASSLLLTVLADQVCYTHFRPLYARFRELTAYPKWRGDCPGACAYHIHPTVILRTIGAPEGQAASLDEISLAALPADLFQTMRTEVTDFCERFLPEIDKVEFWRRCDVEIPTRFKLLYLGSRADAV